MTTCGKHFRRNCTPMLAAGRHSDDGSSFVISETGTEEADNEIRRICFGNNNVRIPTASEIGPGSHQEEDEDEEENRARRWTSGIAQFRSSSAAAAEPWNRWTNLPTRKKKAAILQYFCFARVFRIVTVTTIGDKAATKCCVCPKDTRIKEMQITDCDGCPLFDAWLQQSTWSNSGDRWIIEACGNLILTIQRSESIVVSTEKASCPQISFSSKRLFPRSPLPDGDRVKSACRRWSITDWNGEHFGYLVASGGGEAVFLETADKATVGKFVRQCTLSRRLRTDSTEVTDDFSEIHTPTPRRKLRRNVPCVQKITWTCTYHESGQRLMRLEDDEVVCFDAVQSVNFPTKLLILAGIVKIVGDLHRAFSDYSCTLFSNGRGRSLCCK